MEVVYEREPTHEELKKEEAEDYRKQVSKAESDIEEIVKAWFLSEYEDPSNACPWAEGEYLFLNGGPYDAYEVLEETFGDVLKKKFIARLAKELSEESTEWSPVVKESYHT